MSFSKQVSSLFSIQEKTNEFSEYGLVHEILPSRIVNPPIKPFRRKNTHSNHGSNSSPKRKNYSIMIINKLEKQEEQAKVCFLFMNCFFYNS